MAPSKTGSSPADREKIRALVARLNSEQRRALKAMLAEANTGEAAKLLAPLAGGQAQLQSLLGTLKSVLDEMA